MIQVGDLVECMKTEKIGVVVEKYGKRGFWLVHLLDEIHMIHESSLRRLEEK